MKSPSRNNSYRDVGHNDGSDSDSDDGGACDDLGDGGSAADARTRPSVHLARAAVAVPCVAAEYVLYRRYWNHTASLSQTALVGDY